MNIRENYAGTIPSRQCPGTVQHSCLSLLSSYIQNIITVSTKTSEEISLKCYPQEEPC